MTTTESSEFAVRRRRHSGRKETTARRRRAVDSAADIVAAIHRWAATYGEPPTMLDWDPARARRLGHNWRAERFDAGAWPTARVVRGHFTSFNEAIERAGFRPRRAPTRLRANLAEPAAVLEAIIEWVRRYGDVPAMADWEPSRARRLRQDWPIARYNQGDWPSLRTVVHHFGSLGAAIAAAGLAARSPGPQSAPIAPVNRIGTRSQRSAPKGATAARATSPQP